MPHPVLAGLAGFVSHFVIDIIPHGDEVAVGERLMKPGGVKWLMVLFVLDFAAAVLLVSALVITGFATNTYGAFIGAVSALLPDVLSGFTYVSKKKLWPGFDRFHGWNHRLSGVTVSIGVGGCIQLLTLLVAVALF